MSDDRRSGTVQGSSNDGPLNPTRSRAETILTVGERFSYN
jgi:hypothetical protein